MANKKTYKAHTPPDDDPQRWQTMQDHANNVADMAAGFAAPFGALEVYRDRSDLFA